MKIQRFGKEVELEKIKISRGDILVLKRPKYMQDEKWATLLDMFADDVAKYIGFNTMVIGVDKKFSEIVKLDPDAMEHYGWVRKEKVLALTSDPYNVLKEKLQLAIDLFEISSDEEE